MVHSKEFIVHSKELVEKLVMHTEVIMNYDPSSMNHLMVYSKKLVVIKL